MCCENSHCGPELLAVIERVDPKVGEIGFRKAVGSKPIKATLQQKGKFRATNAANRGRHSKFS